MKMNKCMELESRVCADGNWWDDPKLKRVNAVVIITGCTLAAMTYRGHQQRLLDVLNRSFVANARRIGKEFVPLTEVEAFFYSGEKEHLASTHINKSSILFVAERSGGQPERSGSPAAEVYPLRAKQALTARVDIPPYTLSGKMYAELQHGLVHVIDGDEMFLPMTEVLITPPLPTGEWKFDFVAVNKHQIIRVEESLEATKLPVPAVCKERRREPKVAATSLSGVESPGTGSDGPLVGEESLEATKLPVPAVRKVRRRKPKVAASSPSGVELPGTVSDRPVVSG
jgi:hypothetical protein